MEKNDYPQFIFYVQQQSLKDEDDNITTAEFNMEFLQKLGFSVLPSRIIITKYYVDDEGKMLNRHHKEFPLVECDYPKYYELLCKEYREKFDKSIFLLHVDRCDPYGRIFYVKDGQQIDIPQDGYNAVVKMADELENVNETEKENKFRAPNFFY